MSTFDKVIGYESIKNELLQICDMIRNRELYQSFGANLPHGILLFGDPGLGKTLMARAFAEECGIPCYTVRRNKNTGDFIRTIIDAFAAAKENAPAIVFLDDMDKFANEDNSHRDAEEYVAIQAEIDEAKDCDVFVLATANDLDKLPDSLIRSGRFDSKIEFCPPSGSDVTKIVTHYLSGKRVSADVNTEDISKMLQHFSCADLESVLNAAAIRAAYARKDVIEMGDLVEAVLKTQYAAPDFSIRKTDEEIEMIALHEAGHLVMSEVLCPGSVGLASIRATGRDPRGGFISRCTENSNERHSILIALAGKAAAELYSSETYAAGCQSDIRRAYRWIRNGISRNGALGLSLVDVETMESPGMSEPLNVASEAVVHAELERYLLKARDILMKNRGFLENARDALIRKQTLLYSDIRALRDSATITKAAV